MADASFRASLRCIFGMTGMIGLILLLMFSGCSSPQVMGGVRVHTNVPQATLYVDDELRGPVRDYLDDYLRFEAGPHLISLEHPDYAPARIEVTVSDGVAMDVNVEMRRRSQQPPEDRER